MSAVQNYNGDSTGREGARVEASGKKPSLLTPDIARAVRELLEKNASDIIKIWRKDQELAVGLFMDKVLACLQDTNAGKKLLIKHNLPPTDEMIQGVSRENCIVGGRLASLEGGDSENAMRKEMQKIEKHVEHQIKDVPIEKMIYKGEKGSEALQKLGKAFNSSNDKRNLYQDVRFVKARGRELHPRNPAKEPASDKISAFKLLLSEETLERGDDKDIVNDLQKNIENILRIDGLSKEEIEDMELDSEIEACLEKYNSNLKQLLEFIRSGAIYRVRNLFTLDIMRSLKQRAQTQQKSNSSKNLRYFRVYTKAVLTLVEYLKDYKNKDGYNKLDLSGGAGSNFGEWAKFSPREFLQEVSFFRALPVWPEPETLSSEKETDDHKIKRQVAYRMRVNGVNPRTGYDAVASKLLKPDDVISKGGNMNYNVWVALGLDSESLAYMNHEIGERTKQKVLLQTLFLVTVLGTIKNVIDPQKPHMKINEEDIKSEVPRLWNQILEYITKQDKTPENKIKELLENQVKKNEYEQSNKEKRLRSFYFVRAGLHEILKLKKPIFPRDTEKSRRFTIKVLENAVDKNELKKDGSLNFPLEKKEHFFQSIAIDSDNSEPSGLSRHLIKRYVDIEMKEVDLVSHQRGGQEFEVEKEDLGSFLPVFCSGKLDKEKDINEFARIKQDFRSAFPVRAGVKTDISYFSENNNRARAVYSVVHSLLCRVFLEALGKKADKESGDKVTLLIFRAQEAKQDMSKPNEAETAYYASFRSVVFSLEGQRQVLSQGIRIVEKEKSLSHKKKNAFSSLFGGQPIVMSGESLPDTNVTCGLIVVAGRPCDKSGGLLDREKTYLVRTRSYMLKRKLEADIPTYFVHRFKSKNDWVEKLSPGEYVSGISDEIMDLYNAGAKDIGILHHQHGNSRYHRTELTQETVLDLSSLSGFVSKHPGMTVYPMVRSVLPGLKGQVKGGRRNKCFYELYNPTANAQALINKEEGEERVTPIYSLATLRVIGSEEEMTQFGVSSYHLFRDATVLDTPFSERMGYNLTNRESSPDKNVYDAMRLLLRGIHLLEREQGLDQMPYQEELGVRGVVLDPYADWAYPQNKSQVGEINVGKVQGSDVYVSLSGVLARYEKIYRSLNQEREARR